MAVVGIDIGTQSLKAVITADAPGAILGQAARSYAAAYPRPGWAEQDAGDWERALAPAIAEALAAAGLCPADVHAIGVAGQLDGCVAAGADGDPLGPCLIWMDRRAADVMPPLDAGFSAATGLVADATHMAAKIRWLLGPGGVSGVACFHQPTSYLVARLTGARVMDHALASTTMLYGLAARDWDAGLLRRFGVDRAALPDIADAAAIAGVLDDRGAMLTGLPRGVPVAVGTGDDFATPLGAGLVTPGTVACVLGTAEVVGALHDVPVHDVDGLVEIHGYPGGRYFVENPGWSCGAALAWWRAIVGVADYAAFDALAAQAPPGADGVVFLPALSGAMAPRWVASARGCFYGLTAAHGAAHMCRAVMEGCAFAMRDVIDRLAALGVATDRLLLLGGGAKSALWATMRADISARPVTRASRGETCAVGAAVLAAVAAGLCPSIVHGADAVRGASEAVVPNPATQDAYEDAYARYRRLFASLEPMFAAPLSRSPA